MKEQQKSSRFQQFKVFLARDAKSKLANKQYLLINFLEAPVLALILSFFSDHGKWKKSQDYALYFNNNIPAYILVCVLAALFIGLTVSAEEIFKDRKIRKREAFLRLSKISYLSSKALLLMLISAFQAFTFVVIGNWVLNIPDMLWPYWLVMFSTLFFSNMLGLNISATFNSAVTIYILIPLLIIPQLLLSGIIVRYDQLNPSITSSDRVSVAAELMASRWAFEAIAVHQFMENKYEKPLFELNQQISSSS